MKNNVKTMVYTALLIAFAIIIPVYFGFLKIQAGPFTATIASHVPMFLSMFLGPASAVAVGLGSALGFLITTTPVVATRALMHVFVGLVGALLLKKKVSFSTVVLITAPIHGALEAMAVIPFGFTVYKILVAVGVGTVLHHFVDGIISFGLVKALSKNAGFEIAKNASK